MRGSTDSRSLKSVYMKWLVLLAVADVLVVVFFLAPEIASGATLSQTGIGRILTTTVMPVVVLLIVNLLPPSAKSGLVYWRVRNPLPGSAAFTTHGPADPRVDMEELRKKVGDWPTDPAGQNAFWYRLYKQVSSAPEVVEAHKSFLMYRDMAALSLPLIVVVPPALYWVDPDRATPWLAAGLFALQYLLTAVSARWSGFGFVRNVLALHSVKKVPKPKTAARKKPAA